MNLEKNMRPNIYYFKYSLNNSDTIIDFSNPSGVEVISKNKELQPKELQMANNKLIDLITAYKVLNLQKYPDNNSIKQIVLDIIKILDNVKLINYSAFCAYFQVLKYSYSTYKSEQKYMNENDRIELLKKVLNMYLDNRHNMYSSYGYSDQVLQVMSDISSARRNGKTGIEKIESIIIPNGFIKAKLFDKLLLERSKCYILPDKDGKSLFEEFIRYNQIDFKFSAERDNKYPDLLLKYNDEIFIIEHKMTNGDGGSQNESINEIINFIKQTEKNKNIHYVSCLQGNFIKALAKDNNIDNIDRDFFNIDISQYAESNITTGNKKNKHEHQYSHILQNLKVYPENYFVNGFGLELLISDIINNK